MKNLFLIIAAILTCWLFICISCNKDDSSNEPIIIKESAPVTDYDGNTYKTVRIGDQVWMAENLRTTHYSDGAGVQSFVYDNDESNGTKYGRLYRWSAVLRDAAGSNSNPSGIQGVSPAGWHIPSSAEWQELINNLGGAVVAGSKLKSPGTTDWLEPNTGASNESLLNVLPAGFYRVDGVYMKLHEWGVFYSSTTADIGISVLLLKSNSANAVSETFHPLDALSVRCVKNN